MARFPHWAWSFFGIYAGAGYVAFRGQGLSATLLASLACVVAYCFALTLSRVDKTAGRQVWLWPPFLIAFFFYNNTYPFVLLSGITIEYPGLQASEELTTLANAQSTLAFSIMCLWATAVALRRPKPASKATQTVHRHQRVVPAAMAIAANVALSAVSIAYFLTKADSLPADAGRVDVVQSIDLIQWVTLGWIHLLFFIAAVIAKARLPATSTTSKRLTIATVLLILYCAMDALLGGRKILAAAILAAVYGSIRFGIPRFRMIVVVLPAVLLAASIRAVVYDKFEGDFEDLASLALQLGGEFILTFLTFPTTIAYGCAYYDSEVSSYLMSILQFVPRAVWPEKPFSLAQTLSNVLYDGQQGFAIVPMAEAWCSFYGASGLVLPVILIVMFSVLQRLANSHPAIGFIVYAHAMELNRGEISYFVFQLVLLFGLYVTAGRMVGARTPLAVSPGSSRHAGA